MYHLNSNFSILGDYAAAPVVSVRHAVHGTIAAQVFQPFISICPLRHESSDRFQLQAPEGCAALTRSQTASADSSTSRSCAISVPLVGATQGQPRLPPAIRTPRLAPVTAVCGHPSELGLQLGTIRPWRHSHRFEGRLRSLACGSHRPTGKCGCLLPDFPWWS
jgi:hypothetical protein